MCASSIDPSRRVVAAARGASKPPRTLARVELAAWDARERGSTERLFDAVRPDAVLLAAALSSIAGCERDPALAHALNAELPARVAEVSRSRGVRLVHVSTDLGFGARPPRSGRYREEEGPSPLSVYGRTKAEGEALVLAAHPEALIVRLPLLFGDSGGRGVGASEQLLEAIARGDVPKLFVDEYRTPLEVTHAARALLELVERADRGRLHVAGPERLSRYELGCLILGGSKGQIEAARRADLGVEDLRPSDASLDAARARERLETPLLGPSRVLHRMRSA